jgi:hypothetical protein
MSPSSWDSLATQRDGSYRSLQVETCSLCGLELPLGLMVPDGGHACADVRWYCKDAKSCTQRWTVRRQGSAPRAATVGDASADAGIAEPDGDPEPDQPKSAGSAAAEAPAES